VGFVAYHLLFHRFSPLYNVIKKGADQALTTVSAPFYLHA